MNAPPDRPGMIRLGLGVAFASVAAVSALPPFLTESKDGLLLKLKVQPRASRNKLGDAVGDEWRVWVTAPPVDAAANKAVLELLAEELDLAKSQVQLVRGETARHKVVRITGLSAAELLQRAGGIDPRRAG